MITHTPVTDFLGMKLKHFYKVLETVVSVMKKRSQ